MACMAGLLTCVYILNHLPVFAALQRSIEGLDTASHFMEFVRVYGYIYLVGMVIAGYAVLIVFFWSGRTRHVMRHLSSIVWFTILLYLATLVPSYRLSLFILVTSLCLLGALAGQPGEIRNFFATEQHDDEDEDQEEEQASELLLSSLSHDETDARPVPPSSPGRDSPTSYELRRSWSNRARRNRSVFQEFIGPELEHSGGYFYAVVWCCLTLMLYKFPWLLCLLLIPATLIVVRLILERFSIVDTTRQLLSRPLHLIGTWIHSRRDALMPPPMRAILRFISQADKKIVSGLLSTTDKFVSLLSILVLCVTTLLMAFFLAVQVQSESGHIIQQSTTLGQHVIEMYPELRSMWQGEGNATGMLQSMKEQAHQQGRNWIRTGVRSVVSSDNDDIEDQLTLAWDQLVRLWTNESVVGCSNVSGLSASEVSSQINMTSVFTTVSSNMGTLHTLLDSAWVVVKSNAKLLMGVVTAILSVLLDSGTAVLNLAVIFLTSLMYLLAASDRQYIPLTWLTSLMPPEAGAKSQAVTSVSNAVQGVFGASLKMITFYGLFTFFTHTLFGFEVVFTPAVISALFAAIPLLGSYWVALPASLYLAVAQQSWIKASLLFGLHFLCYNVVDVAIYSEIKGGGHPYLTGLAVAGGMYIFGLEGAVIGPIILCCGLAAMDINRTMLNASIQKT
ncbi:transmembrane protein 245-like isoform X1 [Sycon ciliatum]|uniref:transmembrane protein 245-like isoform X1 n=1 Tax=Sycon ciliatum TaxID=27933 RepID=UPI0031F6D723